MKLCVAVLALCAGPARAEDMACRPLVPQVNEKLVLEQGGQYCLARDLQIERRWNLPDAVSRLPKESLVIAADRVTLDLQGHTIQAGNKSRGIKIGNEIEDRNAKGPQQITLRNGALDSEIAAGIDAGFDALSIPSDREFFGTSHWSSDYTRFVEWRMRARPAGPSGYRQRDIRIENMRIDARDRRPTPDARPGAITIQGAGTVIRNCVIETNAGTAIWIFGPDAIIENNTIIVHGDAPLREADAPIRLHHADGAVIRNNRFIIKGNAHQRGISVFDTGPVTVENNIFYGMTAKDDVARAFTGTLRMKETGSRFEPGWKAMLEIR